MIIKENKSQIRRRQKIQTAIEHRHALRDWYKTPLGRSLLEQENKELESIIQKLFGYHLLQLSEHHSSDYLGKSLIRHHIVGDINAKNLEQDLNVIMEPHNLPIMSDSVDAVILPHTLDVDMNPHQVLREADRVLVPEGRLVMLNFNPWSTWGWRHLFNIWHGDCPYTLRYLSPMRIKDWLVLLGFEIESVKTFYYRLPICKQTLLDKQVFMDKIGQRFWPAFGSVYLITARKQVSTLTPVRPRWFLKRRSGISPGYIETRNDNR